MNLNINYLSLLREFKDKAACSVSQAMEVIKEKSKSSLHLAKENIRFHSKTKSYEDIFRRKTSCELMILSGAVCGIEFCYAAETAFVTPILLSLGLDVKYMTMIWCLSPLIGFFTTPLLGSLSDSCTSKYGRRRPFIIMFSVGIILGLMLVPNGHLLGLAMGDKQYNESFNYTNITETIHSDHVSTYPIGITFTVIGTILLDFCSDACQSPARSYLLDVTIEEDHSRGLSIFTIMAGLGGAIGYSMSATKWENTFFSSFTDNHVRIVFLMVSVFFLVAVTITVTSFKEIPLSFFQEPDSISYQTFINEEELQYIRLHSLQTWRKSKTAESAEVEGYESNHVLDEIISSNSVEENIIEPPTVVEYFKSIIKMPKSLQILCLTNLFCWMSLVCYSLYFTNFVGEVVYNGNPTAAHSSPEYIRYQDGVKFGCWGMALYSLSCCSYSYCIEKLISRFRAKSVYICGQLVYSLGMVFMSLFPHRAGVIIFSTTAGIMYATLFTLPYILIARYHCAGKFEEEETTRNQVRGIGTDVAVVGSMVFLAQFILSSCMGTIVDACGSSVATVWASAILSFCGALSATQVMYLDL
ncbi:membrane-associated transporter protein [Centruroides vittatus]|uniref:membrane-associated transporter protein n=1 Tax=Centruroides vittatus TaxID=120091 RepID=UPI003510082B